MLLVACTLAAPAPKADPQFLTAVSPVHTVSSAYAPYFGSSYVVPGSYVSPYASFYSGLCKDLGFGNETWYFVNCKFQ